MIKGILPGGSLRLRVGAIMEAVVVMVEVVVRVVDAWEMAWR